MRAMHAYERNLDVLGATACFGHRQLSKSSGVVTKMKKRAPLPQHHWFLCKEPVALESDRNREHNTTTTATPAATDSDTDSNKIGIHNLDHRVAEKVEVECEETYPAVVPCAYVSSSAHNIGTPHDDTHNSNPDTYIDNAGGKSNDSGGSEGWLQDSTTCTWFVLKKGIKGLKNIRLNS